MVWGPICRKSFPLLINIHPKVFQFSSGSAYFEIPLMFLWFRGMRWTCSTFPTATSTRGKVGTWTSCWEIDINLYHFSIIVKAGWISDCQSWVKLSQPNDWLVVVSTPLKNMKSSVGTMTFPMYIITHTYIYTYNIYILKKIKSCSKPPTRWII